MNFKYFKYIIISILLISNLSVSANIKLQKVIIKGKPTSIPLMDINNKEYIKADDFAKLISIPINNNLDYLSFKNKSTQILFFPNSLIAKFSNDDENYMVQLHLPVIFAHNTFLLPFPSVFTALDSLNYFEFSQISSQISLIKPEKPKHTILTQNDETEYENDEQINEVFNKIASGKVEEKNKETNESDNNSHNQTKISNNNKGKTAHNNTITHQKKIVVSIDEIDTFPNNDNGSNTINDEIIHLTPNINKNINNKIENNENDKTQESIFQSMQKVDEFGGYIIPKSVKRRKLEELRNYYENK